MIIHSMRMQVKNVTTKRVFFTRMVGMYHSIYLFIFIGLICVSALCVPTPQRQE